MIENIKQTKASINRWLKQKRKNKKAWLKSHMGYFN